MTMKGGRDKESELEWPVIENKRAERGCRMKGKVQARGP